jgi:hypothetical protein
LNPDDPAVQDELDGGGHKTTGCMILENAPGDSENFIYPPRRTSASWKYHHKPAAGMPPSLARWKRASTWRRPSLAASERGFQPHVPASGGTSKVRPRRASLPGMSEQTGRNTPTVPSLDDWEKDGGKIHNAGCSQSCCRWIFGCHWLPSCNPINTSTPRAFYALTMIMRLMEHVWFPASDTLLPAF